MKYTLLIILIICCLSCNKSDLISRQVSWKTVHVSGEPTLFRTGSEVHFANDSIFITTGKKQSAHKMVLTENRLIIETDNEKRLYLTEYFADSLLILKELYTTNEVIIKLRKSDNKKIINP